MELAAVVLGAGAGTRLRPLTHLRAKALCPVNNVPLVDWNIARAQRWTSDVAVNVHHHRAQLVAYLEGRVHLSIEEPAALGTAGALGNLSHWIGGRAVLCINADAWHRDDLERLFERWDETRPRLLVVPDQTRPDFEGRWRHAGACLLPARIVERLPATRSGLFQEVFSVEALDLCESAVPFYDCGTAADYHAANMAASGGTNVVGDGARVEGRIERCVVWPDAVVGRGEHLVNAIRATDGVTIVV